MCPVSQWEYVKREIVIYKLKLHLLYVLSGNLWITTHISIPDGSIRRSNIHMGLPLAYHSFHADWLWSAWKQCPGGMAKTYLLKIVRVHKNSDPQT